MQYQNYLQTAHWKKKREQIFRRHGKMCFVCKSIKNIHVHHRLYKKNGEDILFKEKRKDLIPLCSSCHTIFHLMYGLEAKPQSFYSRARKIYWRGYSKKDSFRFAYNIYTTNLFIQRQNEDNNWHPTYGDVFQPEQDFYMRVRGQSYKLRWKYVYFIDEKGIPINTKNIN